MPAEPRPPSVPSSEPGPEAETESGRTGGVGLFQLLGLGLLLMFVLFFLIIVVRSLFASV